jgi:hypothetical protein
MEIKPPQKDKDYEVETSSIKQLLSNPNIIRLGVLDLSIISE